MKPSRLWPTLTLCLLAAACSSTPTVQSVLEQAQAAMGTPTSLQYSGQGQNGNYGQAIAAGAPWPMRDVTGFTRTVNYEERSMNEVYELNGGRQNQMVNGDAAWNVGGNGAAAQPALAEERQLNIWLTPHGFLQAAAAADDASLEVTEDGNVVSFTALGKYPVTGTINDAGWVTSVATRIPARVLGDSEVVFTYSGYQDFDGIQFPTEILQTQGGFPMWDLTIDSVASGVAATYPIPDGVANATVQPFPTPSEQLAEGVWIITGAPHNSLVVEFDDFLAVVEGPMDDSRSTSVIAEAKRLAPGKPIQYVVNSHHHFDHSGGLRTYIAEGATIVTHEANVPYFTEVFQAPGDIIDDSLARNPREATFEPVPADGMFPITDGTQTLEVYATPGDTHSNELLIAYVPGPGILVEADSYSPQDANARPEPPPAGAVSLYENVQRLELNPSTIVGVHGRGAVPMTEFLRFLGR